MLRQLDLFHAAVLAHFITLYVAAEAIFFLSPRPVFTAMVIAVSLAGLVGVILTDRRSALAAGIALLTLLPFLLLAHNDNVLVADSANYHLPKALFQLSEGSLKTSAGWSLHFTTIVSLHDNFAMMYYLALGQPYALVLPNKLLLFAILHTTNFILLHQPDRGWRIAALVISLYLAAPIVMELEIMKPNVIAPAYWAVGIVVALAGLLANRDNDIGRVLVFASACAFMLLTKITAFAGIAPLVLVGLAVLLIKRGMDFRLFCLLALGVLASAALIGPYAWRYYEFFAANPFPSGASSWALIPPDPICGLTYWSQHLNLLYEQLAQLARRFAGSTPVVNPKLSVLMPENCWLGGNNRAWPLWAYGTYFGLPILVALPLLYPLRSKSWWLFIGIMLIPVFHAMFYVNSVFNTRLIGYAFLLLVVKMAVFHAPRRNVATSLAALTIAAMFLLQAIDYSSRQLSAFEKRGVKSADAIMVKLDGQIPDRLFVRKFRGAERHVGGVMMEILYRRLDRVPFVDGVPADGSGYILFCTGLQKPVCDIQLPEA